MSAVNLQHTGTGTGW